MSSSRCATGPPPRSRRRRGGRRLAAEANGFDLLRPGPQACLRAWRASASVTRASDPTDENLHECRKRSKDLWYHLRLVRRGWPEVIETTADEAHELSDRARRRSRPRRSWPATSSAPSAKLTADQREHLQRADRAAPRRAPGGGVRATASGCFAEKPKRFVEPDRGLLGGAEALRPAPVSWSRVRPALRPPPGDALRRPQPRQADRGRRRQGDARDPPRAARGRRQLQGRQAVHRAGEGALPRRRRARRAQPRPAGGEDRRRGARGADGRREPRPRLRLLGPDGDPDGRPPGLGQDDRLREARQAPRRRGQEGRRSPPATPSARPRSSSW